MLSTSANASKIDEIDIGIEAKIDSENEDAEIKGELVAMEPAWNEMQRAPNGMEPSWGKMEDMSDAMEIDWCNHADEGGNRLEIEHFCQMG